MSEHDYAFNCVKWAAFALALLILTSGVILGMCCR